MSERVYNVLFLCTGNSARSILAEAIVNEMGQGRFRGFSAGSMPKGQVHPVALALLKQLGHPIEELRSKSWDEFAEPDAPKMDFIFTVCDNAANEVCPIWPGQPISAHWGLPDPAAVESGEAEQKQAFADTYQALRERIGVFIDLPVRTLDDMTLQKRLDDIGRSMAAAS